MLKSLFIILFFTLKVCAEIRCFSRSPELSPVDVSDCGDIFEIMESMDKVRAPMHFSRDKSKGFELPHRWHIESCTVLIDMQQEGDEDDFPLADVIQAASDIVRTCVMAPGMPKLGGRNYIGPKEKMFLVVAGNKATTSTPRNVRLLANASRFRVLPSVRNITTS